jgi:hypothetical protein
MEAQLGAEKEGDHSTDGEVRDTNELAGKRLLCHASRVEGVRAEKTEARAIRKRTSERDSRAKRRRDVDADSRRKGSTPPSPLSPPSSTKADTIHHKCPYVAVSILPFATLKHPPPHPQAATSSTPSHSSSSSQPDASALGSSSPPSPLPFPAQLGSPPVS